MNNRSEKRGLMLTDMRGTEWGENSLLRESFYLIQWAVKEITKQNHTVPRIQCNNHSHVREIIKLWIRKKLDETPKS